MSKVFLHTLDACDDSLCLPTRFDLSVLVKISDVQSLGITQQNIVAGQAVVLVPYQSTFRFPRVATTPLCLTCQHIIFLGKGVDTRHLAVFECKLAQYTKSQINLGTTQNTTNQSRKSSICCLSHMM